MPKFPNNPIVSCPKCGGIKWRPGGPICATCGWVAAPVPPVKKEGIYTGNLTKPVFSLFLGKAGCLAKIAITDIPKSLRLA